MDIHVPFTSADVAQVEAFVVAIEPCLPGVVLVWDLIHL